MEACAGAVARQGPGVTCAKTWSGIGIEIPKIPKPVLPDGSNGEETLFEDKTKSRPERSSGSNLLANNRGSGFMSVLVLAHRL